MTKIELINFFVDKVISGEIPFDQVRKNLEGKGFNEQDIREIVRLVDNEVQHGLLTKNSKGIFDQIILVGFVATLIGLVLTVGSFAGLFASGNNYLIVIAYGPLFGGLALIFAGLRRKRRKNFIGAERQRTLKRNWKVKS